MKKSPLMILIVLLVVLPLAPTFAETTKSHVHEKTASASWTNGSSYAIITVYEMTKPQEFRMLRFLLQDPDNGIFILEEKKLTSNELSLTLASCRLNTEIAGSSLTAKWTAIDSCQSEHTNEKIDIKWPMEVSIHLTSTIITRISAHVTLNWNGEIMQGAGQIALQNVVCVAHFSENPFPPSPP